jgi:large subunit ribosomal protein L22e
MLFLSAQKVLTWLSVKSKRYLKYLTKKFLKKQQMREWLRYVVFFFYSTFSTQTLTRLFSVIATSKNSYTLKFFNVLVSE